MEEPYRRTLSKSQIIFDGALMGIADLIPGVSGGSIAFFLGIYDPLLHGIRSFNLESFKLLFRFQFRAFFQKVSWQFLNLLLWGFAVSVLLFFHLVHFLLMEPLYKTFLYSFFLGLIVASIRSIFMKVRRWEISHWFSLMSGIFISLTLWGIFFKGAQWNLYTHSTSLFQPYVFFSGILAIWAMLLPGISGSFILLMFGMYLPMVESLKNFSQSLITLSPDTSALLFLGNLGIGILIGMALFSRLILWMMSRWRVWVLAHLVGFMIGSIPAIWPFGETLTSGHTISRYQFGFSLIIMTIGFFLFALLQKIHQEKVEPAH